MAVPQGSAGLGEWWWPRTTADRPHARSQFAFLRFVAGMRALLALLGGLALVASSDANSPALPLGVLLYLVLAAALLMRTLDGRPQAMSHLWLWVDALALAAASHYLKQEAPWLGLATVVPVVAMSLLAGAAHALVLTLFSVTSLLVSDHWSGGIADLPTLTLALPLLVLAIGPTAAFLAQPTREMRRRLGLLEAFTQRSDPRQGLGHHVDVLLDLLHEQFRLNTSVISLQGPEPRVFAREAEGRFWMMEEPHASQWRERRKALPAGAGCLRTNSGKQPLVAIKLDSFRFETVPIDPTAERVLLDLGPEALTLPLMSYGKPLGHLCLTRKEPPFTTQDLQWLHELMCEVLPLLERADLLEQLQRETAARERERIGRDLHDSAVQPYLGLKYGLEALERQTAPDNPVKPLVEQLVALTNQELQTLRDVVTGLRRGGDPLAVTAFIGALHRQVERFEALYGLKVNIFAPDALQLRGSAAKAVLHMVNEALTNVRRHTAAAAVTVMLDVRDGQVVMRVRNDHGGIAPSQALPEAFVPRSLTDRAAELGGSVAVSREPNLTEITINLPMLGAIG
jgi:signal transduction histidine kinase